jgi:hypothetical protein
MKSHDKAFSDYKNSLQSKIEKREAAIKAPDNVGELIDSLARGYVAVLNNDSPIVPVSHIHLARCYKMLPPRLRPQFDTKVTELLKP